MIYKTSIYLCFKEKIKKYIMKNVWSEQDAEELTDDVFVTYFEKYDLEDKTDILKTLYKIAKNKKGNYYTTHKDLPQIISDELLNKEYFTQMSINEDILQKETVEEINSVLNDECKQIFKYLLEGYSQVEIAKKLGTTQPYISNMVMWMRTILAEKLNWKFRK